MLKKSDSAFSVSLEVSGSGNLTVHWVVSEPSLNSPGVFPVVCQINLCSGFLEHLPIFNGRVHFVGIEIIHTLHPILIIRVGFPIFVILFVIFSRLVCHEPVALEP